MQSIVHFQSFLSYTTKHILHMEFNINSIQLSSKLNNIPINTEMIVSVRPWPSLDKQMIPWNEKILVCPLSPVSKLPEEVFSATMNQDLLSTFQCLTKVQTKFEKMPVVFVDAPVSDGKRYEFKLSIH